MKIYNKKKDYIAPDIYRIELDNEISMAMESEATDPMGEPDDWSKNQHNISSDPFKDHMG